MIRTEILRKQYLFIMVKQTSLLLFWLGLKQNREMSEVPQVTGDDIVGLLQDLGYGVVRRRGGHV